MEITSELEQKLVGLVILLRNELDIYEEELEKAEQVSWEDSDYGTYLGGKLEGVWLTILELGGIQLMHKINDQIQKQKEGEVQE